MTLGTVSLPADPISNFAVSIPQIIISGWEMIGEEFVHASRFPCVFCYVTEVDLGDIEFQQELLDANVFAASIKLVDQGANREVLEKKVYRYVAAIHEMMRNDRVLQDSGWFVRDITRAYSGTTPTEVLTKAGMVSFSVTISNEAWNG